MGKAKRKRRVESRIPWEVGDNVTLVRRDPGDEANTSTPCAVTSITDSHCRVTPLFGNLEVPHRFCRETGRCVDRLKPGQYRAIHTHGYTEAALDA